jgi:hypothetical protein
VLLLIFFFFFLFRNIFSLETIWLHHEGNSDLVEPDPYNLWVRGEKWYGYRGGGPGEEEKKPLSKRKTKQRIASNHFVTVCWKYINVKLFILKNCRHISFNICHIAINKVSSTKNCIELYQCPTSFLCTLFFPQMSNFWENVVSSFYLTSQAKTEFTWQLLELTNSEQFLKWNAGRWVDGQPQTDYRFLYFVQRMLEVQSNMIISYNFLLQKHFTLSSLKYLQT